MPGDAQAFLSAEVAIVEASPKMAQTDDHERINWLQKYSQAIDSAGDPFTGPASALHGRECPRHGRISEAAKARFERHRSGQQRDPG